MASWVMTWGEIHSSLSQSAKMKETYFFLIPFFQTGKDHSDRELSERTVSLGRGTPCLDCDAAGPVGELEEGV